MVESRGDDIKSWKDEVFIIILAVVVTICCNEHNNAKLFIFKFLVVVHDTSLTLQHCLWTVIRCMYTQSSVIGILIYVIVLHVPQLTSIYTYCATGVCIIIHHKRHFSNIFIRGKMDDYNEHSMVNYTIMIQQALLWYIYEW